MSNRVLASLVVSVAAAAVAAVAVASAPPVGPLPDGPVRAIAVKPDRTFVVSLPKSQQPGLVWRLARRYRTAVVRQLAEGETSRTVWLRFRSLAPGTTSLVFGLTRGERSHAYAARSFRITVA